MKSTSVIVHDNDRGSSARQEFARRLAALHRAAGAPSLRSVAMLAQQRAEDSGGGGRSALASAQRISDWMSGRNVPAKFESLRPVLHVLAARARRRAGTPVRAVNLREWRALWSAARTAPPDRAAVPVPELYPAGGAYTPAHENIFFGRQRALAALLELVRASASPHRAADLVVLTGASGVGKSSLLQAGVLPVLAAETQRWAVVALTPGPDPLRSLGRIRDELSRIRDEAAGPAGRAGAPGRRALIIIDQFEELFAQGVEPVVREDFLVSVRKLCAGGSVIVSVRSDHLAECAQHPWLAHAIRHNGFTLNPMTRQELTAAIVGPPRTRGVTVDQGVVELLLTALESPRYCLDRQPADPGALPVLHAALRSMWARCADDRPTVADYRRIGGLEHTVRALAEQAWDELSPGARTDARQILLALVTVHRDGTVTRRRLPVGELRRAAARSAGGPALVDRLVRARLITVDYKYAALVHDALLGWDRLSAWISEHRAPLLWRHRIEEDAAEWDTADRDPGLLYRGIRLTTAVRHADPALTAVATEFLRLSARAELADPAADPDCDDIGPPALSRSGRCR